MTKIIFLFFLVVVFGKAVEKTTADDSLLDNGNKWGTIFGQNPYQRKYSVVSQIYRILYTSDR